MTISEKWIEAGAMGLHEVSALFISRRVPWSELDADMQNHFRKKAQAALSEARESAPDDVQVLIASLRTLETAPILDIASRVMITHAADLLEASTLTSMDDGWRPIDDEAKNGEPWLVMFRGHGVLRVTWENPHGENEEYAIWCVDDFKHGPFPVHGYSEGDDLAYRPLPAPPRSEP